jgi:hypothetical protein
MKLKQCALMLLLTAATSQAALYTLGNGSGSTAAGVETIEGKVFRSGTVDGATLTGTNTATSGGPGVVAFGVFSTDSLSTVATASELVNLFTQFGAVGTFGAASTGGNRSVFSRANTATITGSAFAGKAIYFFAGNADTFANSTQFLVAKMDTEIFSAGDDTTFATAPKSITINPGNSTTLLGKEVANVWTTSSDATTNAGWQMATLVPEPSAALLGALGALGLLRRRRA